EAGDRVAEFLGGEALSPDCNPCSPTKKDDATRTVETAGAVYVEVAVMSPVYPARSILIDEACPISSPTVRACIPRPRRTCCARSADDPETKSGVR
ncbi:hypothetical protein AB9E28_34535, partial [Rhizobium leguminosarum]